jgi:hypothetical protein
MSCKHAWHFLEKKVNGRIIFAHRGIVGFIPVDIVKTTQAAAIFVCDKCGSKKEVKIDVD